MTLREWLTAHADETICMSYDDYPRDGIRADTLLILIDASTHRWKRYLGEAGETYDQPYAELADVPLPQMKETGAIQTIAHCWRKDNLRLFYAGPDFAGRVHVHIQMH